MIRVNLSPWHGWYRLQAGGVDNDTLPEDFVNPGPRGYGGDYGGIWIEAHGRDPADVNIEVWPVDAQPDRPGTEVAFDGEFEVPDTGEDSGQLMAVLPEYHGTELLDVRLEPGVWRLLITTRDNEWWVDIIDTAEEPAGTPPS
jgi:hypothetical protein